MILLDKLGDLREKGTYGEKNRSEKDRAQLFYISHIITIEMQLYWFQIQILA